MAREVSTSTPRRVLRLFGEFRGRVVVLLATILASSLVGIVNPLLTKVLFDRGLFPRQGKPDVGLLTVLGSLMLAFVVLGGALGIAQTYLATSVGQAVMHRLRQRLYTHLQGMSLRFFTAARTGDVQSRLANDVDAVSRVVTETATVSISNVVFVLSSLVAMFALSWQLTLLSLFLVPLFVYLTYRIGRIRRGITARTQETVAQMNVITEETLSVAGMILAKVFDPDRRTFARYSDESGRLAQLRTRQQMVGRTVLGLAQTFFLATPVLVYVVGGYLLAHGSGGITAGTIVAFSALQTRVFYPATSLMDMSIEIQSSLALFDRIFHYLDLPRDILERPNAITLHPEKAVGEIRFEDVYFSYDSHEKGFALRGVTFDVHPGQLAAVVGPSGAGKTTLSYLVPRFYDVTNGAVTIDGLDVRDLTLTSLSQIVGVVTQETYLFHASVRDNLLYANPSATQDVLEAAARRALIHDRIEAFPDGYDTVVGERGYRLSGGERQRLAIARVFLKDPRILILDEATSALDSASERLVQEALAPLMRDRTTIAIAHRLSTIIAADVILVLDNGEVVERGTHPELVNAGGLYARLFEQQFGAAVSASN